MQLHPPGNPSLKPSEDAPTSPRTCLPPITPLPLSSTYGGKKDECLYCPLRNCGSSKSRTPALNKGVTHLLTSMPISCKKNLPNSSNKDSGLYYPIVWSETYHNCSFCLLPCIPLSCDGSSKVEIW